MVGAPAAVDQNGRTGPANLIASAPRVNLAQGTEKRHRNDTGEGTERTLVSVIGLFGKASNEAFRSPKLLSPDLSSLFRHDLRNVARFRKRKPGIGQTGTPGAFPSICTHVNKDHFPRLGSVFLADGSTSTIPNSTTFVPQGNASSWHSPRGGGPRRVAMICASCSPLSSFSTSGT